MSFLSNLFGRPKKNLPENLSSSIPPEKPSPEPARGGTTLRKQDDAPSQPERKAGPELSALEMAERRDWEVKTLPVWKPGDEILGLYRVEDVMEGGMGRVYIAHHKGWNVKLAIKSPNEMMLSDRNNFARVLREANSWTELGLHPNIAYCYYVRSIEDVPHIFVEYVDGGNLRQWIEEGKCIDYRVSLDLAIQFCHGMEWAHSKGMIHRDIKPENVLITKDGVLKITDFGLVRAGAVIGGGKGTVGVSGKGMTRLGDVMGTEGFMAPEQFTDAAGVDERADIFSFGVCLYEMCCGARPYDITIGERKDSPDPVKLSRDAKFPPALAEALRKCVQWERDKRYGTFKEIRERFNTIYRGLFHQESPYAELELVDLEASGLNNRGVSYFELGRNEDALSCWEQALKLNPLHLETTYNLSLMKWRGAKIADDEVLRRLDNCGKNPAVDRQKLAELKAFIHAERTDVYAARDVLKEFPGRYEVFFSDKDFEQGRSALIMVGGVASAAVRALALTPDCRHAVLGSEDKTLRLWELASGRCVHTMEGHTKGVSSVTITPDGRYIVSASDDSTLRVWEQFSGRLLRTLDGHRSVVNSVAITPDGRYMVSGSEDKTLRVWEIASGQCVHILEGHTDGVTSVGITADGRYGVSGGSYNDKTLRVWDLSTGQCVHILVGHTDEVSSAAITLDGRYAVSGDREGTVRVWELATGRCVQSVERHKFRAKVALTADNRYVVSFSEADKTARVIEFASHKCVRTLEGHTGGLSSVAFIQDSQYAVSYSQFDNTARVWEFASGRCVHTMEGIAGSVTAAAVNTDGLYAASGVYDNTVRVWRFNTDIRYTANLHLSALKGFKERKKERDALEKAIIIVRKLYEKRDYKNSYLVFYKTWKENEFSENASITELYLSLMRKGRIKGLHFSFQNRLLIGHTDRIKSIALTPNNQYVVSGSWDKTVRVWELSSGQCARTFEGHTDIVWAVAVSPDGQYVVSGSFDKTLRIWEFATGRCVHILKGHTARIHSVAITPDGRYVVSGSEDKTLRVWELSGGRYAQTMEYLMGWPRSITFTADGSYAVSVGGSTLLLWEVASGRCVHALKGHKATVTSVALTPGDRYAVSSSDDKTVRIWELATGLCVRILDGHTNKINLVMVTPDGLYAVSGSWDKTLRVWELESGRCIHTLEGNTSIIKSAAITPDGLYAFSGSSDKTLRVWELEAGRCVKTLEGFTNEVDSISFVTGSRFAVLRSEDNILRFWEFIWDLDFPDPVDWDEGVRPYLDIFLTLRKGKWGEEDFKLLIDELASKRGYGWVRPEGIRSELEKMTKGYSDSPRLP